MCNPWKDVLATETEVKPSITTSWNKCSNECNSMEGLIILMWVTSCKLYIVKFDMCMVERLLNDDLWMIFDH